MWGVGAHTSSTWVRTSLGENIKAGDEVFYAKKLQSLHKLVADHMFFLKKWETILPEKKVAPPRSWNFRNICLVTPAAV